MAEKRYKKLKTAAELQRLMQWHYTRIRLPRLGRPLAWVTSGAPVEILRAMGVIAVYPENYGALCGARREAVSLCEAAEAQGYSPDLCSYARTSLGSVFQSERAPMGGLPQPDLLIACNNICGTVIKWYEAVAAHYEVPLFILDTPFIHGAFEPHALAYVVAQLEAMIRFVERTTGRRLSMKRLERTVRLANETVQLWSEIRALCKARPSPLNAPDLFVNMAPIVVLRGTEGAVRFYRHLKAEVEMRVKNGIGAIPKEKYRLLWDNIAIWHHLYRFYNYFVDYDACFVVDTYTGGWSQEIPEGQSELMEGIATAYATVFLNQSLEYRSHLMERLIREYDVDGFVMHCNRSCKPYSLGQYAIRRRITEGTGVPGLIIESDMCDARAFAAEAVKTRIQAFMETLAERK
ncbi:MAG: 2-hydroxyacyl-CoA dehydratase [Chloroflexi bacterium]|nr:2-hydroxyacyl-CoA dehydratase [Chloroflexota bacterium]